MDELLCARKDKTVIQPFKEQNLKIYAYTLPDVPNHNGYIKVGETSRDVKARIKEQTKTAGLKFELLFDKTAKKESGEWFHDKDLHKYFILNNIKQEDFGTGASEWFYFNGNPEKAEQLTDKFIANNYDSVGTTDGNLNYVLRREQKEAVEKTLNYYNNSSVEREFLWNAKPRFGKTLTTYDFIRKIKGKNVLIVTNRPAISNSWLDDFNKFIGWQEERLKFVSETDSLVGKPGVFSYKQFDEYLLSNQDKDIGCVAFLSLQDLKGAKIFGGNYDKLEWVSEVSWDLLVIDEAHEGVDTAKTDRAFNRIKSDFILHLSGTPFKALVNNKFSEEQIYNWFYVDEQLAKEEWDRTNGELSTNPYSSLPTLNMFTYQMSKIIEDKVSVGKKIAEEINVDYAFDLNEFFKTKPNGEFIYEQSVQKFLNNLSTRKFPFAESEYRHMLNHTFWLLPGVAACKALQALLKKDDYFKDYEIVLAAGDGISLPEEDVDQNLQVLSEDGESNKKSFDKVKEAIAENEKTITLSCGQLTTGITIPEWSGVFMLSNIKSPSLYFQAAFRSQNPYEFKDEETGELYRKENAYIFDFAPERTLILFDEFANNLSASSLTSTTDERKNNIRKLINFFPVIAEDETGELHELNAEEVLTIPNQIKSQEVVKCGFMSNLLFANISAIFRASPEMKEIIDKLEIEHEKKKKGKKEIYIPEGMYDDYGNVDVPDEIVINKKTDIFGEKIYGISDINSEKVLEKIPDTTTKEDLETLQEKKSKELSKEIFSDYSSELDKFKTEFGITKGKLETIVQKSKNKLAKKIKESIVTHTETLQEIETKYEEKIKAVKTEEELDIIKEKIEEEKSVITTEFEKDINSATKDIFEDIIKEEIVHQEEVKKKKSVDDVRDHLRGFARTIPAFLMAYGDRETTLANFDKKVDEKTFKELTSITLEEFCVLRDGFVKDKDGVERKVPGLFDEIVFNASIEEFLNLKDKLSDYLGGKTEEDIFDYIPLQETNQVFTPKRVVELMIDLLEKENPELFKRKDSRFIDLYVKSGLYMTEIIKRLNKGLEKEIPNKEERIKHIMENQVYGYAPSNIIYNMVKNYIYKGYDYVDSKNLILEDIVPLAIDGKLEERLKERFGKEMKFDAIIGNPPYQENISESDANSSLAKQLFPLFVKETIELNPDYISLIIPARWFTGDAQDKSFLKLRKYIKNNNHISKMHYYEDAREIFPNVEIKGGVCYFVWDRSYSGKLDFYTHKNNKEEMTNRELFVDGVDIILTHNIYLSLLEKVLDKNFSSLTEITKGRNAFGIIGKENVVNKISETKPFKNSYELRCKGNEIRYISADKVIKNKELFKKWKIFISKSAGAPHKDKNVIPKSFVGGKNTACTDSLIPIGDFDTEIEAKNLKKYMMTKFLRVLVQLAKSSQNITQIVYKFVPLQDFTEKSDIDWSKSIPEIDKQLYKKYHLTKKEIDYIEKSIKPMN